MAEFLGVLVHLVSFTLSHFWGVSLTRILKKKKGSVISFPYVCVNFSQCNLSIRKNFGGDWTLGGTLRWEIPCFSPLCMKPAHSLY